MASPEELRAVLWDAHHAGDPRAVQHLGRALATQLGVGAAGIDAAGLWLSFSVAGAPQRMRWIEPGRYVRGSPEDEPERFDDEGAQHVVVLTEGLWLGETPVTQALWHAITGENPSDSPDPRAPVEQVSWLDCQRFCEQLRAIVPLGFGLPTEAQWEYAARAGTTGPRYDPDLEKIAWSDRSGALPGPQPVGRKQPNAWGLHDMLGNVWEWCADHTESEPYEAVEQIDPFDRTGSLRVFRGGSWDDDALMRAACRSADEPDFAAPYIGLRLACGWPPGGADGSCAPGA